MEMKTLMLLTKKNNTLMLDASIGSDNVFFFFFLISKPSINTKKGQAQIIQGVYKGKKTKSREEREQKPTTQYTQTN